MQPRRSLIDAYLSESHWVYHLEIVPHDVGFCLIRRPRLYTILYCKAKVRLVADPAATFNEVSKRMCCRIQKSTSVACVSASPAEILAYENILRSKRNKNLAPLQSASADWTYLLSHNQRAPLRLQEVESGFIVALS